MSDDLSITKKMVVAFQPKYTLSEQQLMKYRTNVGAYDYEAEEIDEALQYSREKLSDILANRGVPDNSVSSARAIEPEEGAILPKKNTFLRKTRRRIGSLFQKPFPKGRKNSKEKINIQNLPLNIENPGSADKRLELNTSYKNPLFQQ
jgi:hypothetical protein